MKLPEHERQAHRDAFKAMSLGQKLEYIFAYYKLPLVLIFIACVALGSVAYQKLTHKDALLYVGMANVTVNEKAEQLLTTDYVRFLGGNPRKQEVYLYRELYLIDAEETTDHQYSYASRLKLLATIDAEQFDVVLMNRTSYDLLSHSGFLKDLTSADVALSPDLQVLLQQNDVILEDNDLEVRLGEAEEYEAETTVATNALDVTATAPFEGFEDDVYLGIIGNTPRLDDALAYVEYLFSL